MRENVKKKRDTPKFPILYYIQIFAEKGHMVKSLPFLLQNEGCVLYGL